MNSPDLNNSADYPFAQGADEIVLRVSRYADGLRTPACFQAIVKHRNRNLVWGIGMGPAPAGALRAAFENFKERNGAPWPDGAAPGREAPVEEEDIFG